MIIGLNAFQFHEQNSGMGQYIKSLYSKLVPMLVEEGHKVFIYQLQDSPSMSITEYGNKVEYVIVSLKRKDTIYRVFYEQTFLGARLWWDNIDIYFTPDTKIPFFLSPKMKIVTIMHDMCVYRWPEEYMRSRVLYWQWAFKRCLEKSNEIIAISEFTKNEIIDILKLSGEKITVAHNGIDSKFAPVHDLDILKCIRQKYKLPQRFILFVGMVSPRKNIRTLLEAFSIIKDKYSDLNIVIVGSRGWKDETDMAMVDTLQIANRVIFPGYVADEDIAAIYSLAEATVYPSLYEGFGWPPVESMACGTPCIAANTSSIPEVTGKAAILVSPDAKSVALGLEQLFSMSEIEKQDMIIKGLLRVKKFKWDNTAKKIGDIITSTYRSV